MSIELFCPECDTLVKKLKDGWQCTNPSCGWFRPFIDEYRTTHPVIRETIHHITRNGKDSLCGSDGDQVHISYVTQQQDQSHWCKRCQELAGG
jgi:hypothetical protein